jgi:hypothetical protein
MRKGADDDRDARHRPPHDRNESIPCVPARLPHRKPPDAAAAAARATGRSPAAAGTHRSRRLFSRPIASKGERPWPLFTTTSDARPASGSRPSHAAAPRGPPAPRRKPGAPGRRHPAFPRRPRPRRRSAGPPPPARQQPHPPASDSSGAHQARRAYKPTRYRRPTSVRQEWEERILKHVKQPAATQSLRQNAASGRPAVVSAARRPSGSVSTRGQLAWIGTSWWLPSDAACPLPRVDGAGLAFLVLQFRPG